MTRYGSRRKPIEIGFRSGKLVVVKESNKRSSDRQIMYECLCDCGEVSIVRGQHLRHRITLSCGCLIKEHIASVNRSHEMSGSSTHRAWTNMKTRCTNKSIPDYVHYGERGIKVCSRWQNSFGIIPQCTPDYVP